MKFSRIHVLLTLMWSFALLFAGCAKQEMPDNREKDYGYVQFKLYKKASYEATKAVSQMEYLNDAAKVMVLLQYGERQLTQTMVLSATDAAAAEYGLRSEKVQLLAGNYKVVAYTLYDRLDNELYYGGESGEFTVVAGGLQVHDLLADVVERGKVRFTLVKNFIADTKAADAKTYTFDEISYIDVVTKDVATGLTYSHDMLPADFSIHFDETDDVEDGYQTSSSQCDTLVSLPAGKYVVSAYTLYGSDKKVLEVNPRMESEEFEVADNKVTDADLPVDLKETAPYIKDYIVLKKIWEALDGENWYYKGDEWPVGSNWDFNKDVDLWGAQPGVKIHSNGRVALISLAGFSFSGELPKEIGELEELNELYLGHHNEINLLANDPTVMPGMNEANRMQRHKEYLSRTHRITQMSEPIARGLMEHGISIPEISLYETMTEEQVIDKATGDMRIKPMDDVLPGVYANGLTKIPEEIGNLKQLHTFFIANGRLKELPLSLANLEELTDFEVYNCPDMVNFPTVVSQIKSLVSVNLSANPQWVDVDEGFRALASGPAGKSIQILYMNECGLTVLPKEVNQMTKLGLLSLASNKIHTIESAFPDVAFTQLHLDNNRIESIPHFVKDGKRQFFRIDDVESITFSYNRLKKVPDVFDADAVFGMTSVDFSYNDIDGFENEDTGEYQGIYVNTLSLANNPKLGKYPVCLAKTGSKVSYINLRGCGMTEVPGEAFKGENVQYLMSLDLSYNKIKDLPYEFHGAHMPYLYGVDLSYNRFDHFPFEPFDAASLTMLAVRGQRDANGNRCLSEWPQGVYNHTGLRALYLGSNNIGKVEDTISYLIYYLDISDNPEIVFDATDICYNWMAGTYFLLYDKTQEIRGCDAMLE